MRGMCLAGCVTLNFLISRDDIMDGCPFNYIYGFLYCDLGET